MKEADNFFTCDRAGDLMAVLYGEASESERQDLEVHAQHCRSCQSDLTAFARVRESIGAWRDEALSGLAAAKPVPAAARKSALAALRQFFDLSPLWLKGAIGFAVLLFCALLALTFAQTAPTNTPERIAHEPAGEVYTREDLDRAVQAALANQQLEPPVPELSKPADERPVRRAQSAKSQPKARRPFSKAERDQLAAELRLVSSDETLDLDVLDERLNRQR